MFVVRATCRCGGLFLSSISYHFLICDFLFTITLLHFCCCCLFDTPFLLSHILVSPDLLLGCNSLNLMMLTLSDVQISNTGVVKTTKLKPHRQSWA